MDKSLFTRLTPLELSVKQSEELKENHIKDIEKLEESIRELQITDAFSKGFSTALNIYGGYEPYEASVEARTFTEDNLVSSSMFFGIKD